MSSAVKILLSIMLVISSAANGADVAADSGGNDEVKTPTIRFTPDGRPVAGTTEASEQLHRLNSAEAIIASGRYQQCDPKLLENFYDQLYLLACQKSQLSACPMKWDMESLLKNSASSIMGYAMLATHGVTLVTGDLNKQAMDRAKAAFANFAPRAERMFGPQAAEHFRRMAAASDAKELKSMIASGQTTFAGAQNSRYAKFLGLLKGSQRVRPAGLLRALGKAKFNILGMLLYPIVESLVTPTEARNCPHKIAYIDYTDGCKTEVEVDGEIKIGDEVKKFLDLNPRQQQTLLNANPQLCAYYKKFNDAIMDKVQISGQVQNVRCDAGNGTRQYTVDEGRRGKKVISLKMSPEGKVQELHMSRGEGLQISFDRLNQYRFKFTEADGATTLTRAEYTNNFGINASISYEQLSTDASRHRRHAIGDNLTVKADDMFGTFRQHKFYSSLVNTCCGLTSDETRAKCVTELQGHQGISIGEAADKADEHKPKDMPQIPPAAMD